MCFNTFVCSKLNALLYWTGFVHFGGGKKPGKSLSLKMLFSGQDVDRIERQHAPTVKLTLMAGSCSFNNIWLHTRKYKWWLEKTEDKGKAKCVICDKTFDISYTGRQHCPATLKQQASTIKGFSNPRQSPQMTTVTLAVCSSTATSSLKQRTPSFVGGRVWHLNLNFDIMFLLWCRVFALWCRVCALWCGICALWCKVNVPWCAVSLLATDMNTSVYRILSNFNPDQSFTVCYSLALEFNFLQNWFSLFFHISTVVFL